MRERVLVLFLVVCIRVILVQYRYCDIRDCYIGIISRMASEEKESGKKPTEARKHGPVIQPSEFSGSGDWTTWIRKFQRLAELYTNPNLLVRLVEHLRHSTKPQNEDFSAVVDALTHRFEPEAKQQLFQEKLLAYERKEDEDWATVGEKLKEIASHAYPDSDNLAEGFALSRFLTLLERDMELAIGVQRSTPMML